MWRRPHVNKNAPIGGGGRRPPFSLLMNVGGMFRPTARERGRKKVCQHLLDNETEAAAARKKGGALSLSLSKNKIFERRREGERERYSEVSISDFFFPSFPPPMGWDVSSDGKELGGGGEQRRDGWGGGDNEEERERESSLRENPPLAANTCLFRFIHCKRRGTYRRFAHHAN